MRGKIKRNALIMSLIASFLAVTFATAPALAPVTPTLAGPIIENIALTPGSTFVANITISDVEWMLGYQFTLSWDSSILTVTAVKSWYPFIYKYGSSIDIGTLYMVFGYELPEPVGFWGSMGIAEITFRVEDYGYSPLDLSGTVIAHVSGDAIEHIVEGGYFYNLEVARRADLGKRRAYAENPVWHLYQDADNTLTGLVKNFGTVAVKVKVEFSVTDGVTTRVFSTNEDLVSPKKTVRVSVTLTEADMNSDGFEGFGDYYWTARAYYDHDGDDGTAMVAGLRTKTQHLEFDP